MVGEFVDIADQEFLFFDDDQRRESLLRRRSLARRARRGGCDEPSEGPLERHSVCENSGRTTREIP